MKIIEEKLQTDGFPQRVRQSALQEQAANHVLLFTSALVPKALASMLTAFVVHTANRVGGQRLGLTVLHCQFLQFKLSHIFKSIILFYLFIFEGGGVGMWGEGTDCS